MGPEQGCAPMNDIFDLGPGMTNLEAGGPASASTAKISDDPNGCREQALRCAELGRHAASPEARDHFMSLHDSWLRLAADIESSQKLLELLDEIARDLEQPAYYVEAAE